MQAIFNGPMCSNQFQQPLRGRLGRSQAGETVHDLLRTVQRLLDPPPQTKDLSDPMPGWGKELIEFSGGHQRAPFQASMCFLAGLGDAPVAAIGGWLAKKEA